MPRAEFGALIADDEPAARRGVRQLLSTFPEFEVVAECADGAAVLAALDLLRPHVVFLDIQMPGIDGLEVIRRRGAEHMPAVVILTAYDQFAIRAFEAQALDYLLKPVTESRFAATMKRLVAQLRGITSRDENIVVTSARGTQILRAREVDWIEAADNYVRIWIGTKNYLLRESLAELELRVSQLGFMRAHRRALVRLGAVRELVWTAAGELVAVLASGSRVPVSRRRRVGFAAAVRSLRG